uniref:PiggyBac transposable element-derived protein domain-containing protein n=1 Tax=Graphocephala atropunctata TaxID=36148 RepID=A0A1B6KLU3_9HEMI
MFDPAKSGLIYKANFSEKRFRFLVDCLRFDDKATREARRQSDKLAAIREIWDQFILTCTANYEPGPYLTIDEQLLAFRGRCPFKMYIPNKPAKYGIKIVMICDVGSKYMLNAEPYLGKQTTPRDVPVSEYFVKKLISPYNGTNRNLTMDNWFTSIPLVDELKEAPFNITVVGTVRLNKPEIPRCLLFMKNRAIGDSRFIFNGTTTLVSVKVKSNKVICLTSTMHEGTEIEPQSGKPSIVHHYNQTKVGVDCFDQMCSVMSCSRKTKRWPLCLFFGMMNMAFINSYVIYNRRLASKGETLVSRKCFMEELYKGLTTPWLEERLRQVLQRSLRSTILTVLGREDVQAPELPPAVENRRTTCRLCPASKRRMTKSHCAKCNKPFCGEHRADICRECI